MKAIDPNAVIDAIARLFPDGFDYENEGWEDALSDDLFEVGLCDTVIGDAIHACVDRLVGDGRLREFDMLDEGRRFVALSHAEYGRRIVAAWYGFEELEVNPDECALDIEMIANVLAGKTEKI